MARQQYWKEAGLQIHCSSEYITHLLLSREKVFKGESTIGSKHEIYGLQLSTVGGLKHWRGLRRRNIRP